LSIAQQQYRQTHKLSQTAENKLLKVLAPFSRHALPKSGHRQAAGAGSHTSDAYTAARPELRPYSCSSIGRRCRVRRFFVLSSFIILALIGLGGREARVRTAGTAAIHSVRADEVGSPVVPAILYSDSNTVDLWHGSADLATVAAYRHRRYRRHRRVVVVRKRKFSHSAAIVGGSAAGGAAIGALAGGGKGAAIGALVGGGAGLVYDRKTHKKRVVVER
jgi:hypothetical protein